MVEGGILKVCYRKRLAIIDYEPTNCYDQIIKLIIQSFNIPASHESALLISTESGRIFDKLLFDYFLTLFPSPSIIFYIRYDYNRAVGILQSIQQEQQQQQQIKTVMESSDINMKEKKKVKPDGEEDKYKFTPVFRMNCFIYEYPTTKIKAENNSGKKQKSSAVKHSPRSEFMKRVKKHLQVGELKKRTRKPLAQVKRIMRL